MARSKTKKRNKKYRAQLSVVFYKELIMAFLALLSVFFVFYEYLYPTSQTMHLFIVRFDIAVAVIFLVDFFVAFSRAPDKSHYLRHNWYLLLASIPIVDGWAELLRGLRLLELVRLVRAGSHLTYVYESVKESK